jgi:hypothetical protein
MTVKEPFSQAVTALAQHYRKKPDSHLHILCPLARSQGAVGLPTAVHPCTLQTGVSLSVRLAITELPEACRYCFDAEEFAVDPGSTPERVGGPAWT